jgi:Flp pilus assembly pilin Flp
MTRRLSARYVIARRDLRSERGAATAEYAVVTVAAAGLGGVLIKLLTSDWFQDILKTVLETVIRAALSFFGIGG